MRRALRVLQASGFAVTLAALPYHTFELDRHTMPKELALHLAALAGALCCLQGARRLTVFAVDGLIAGFLLLTALSAALSTNGWLAFRALGVSLAGATLFWTARAVARAGYGRQLLAALAAAITLGALTALAQAYGLASSGLASSGLASLSRAPGGTFGNRNFMAHLVAIGLPVVLLLTLEARSRARFAVGAGATTLLAAALFLSRSRAGWLGAALSAVFLAVEGFWIGRLWEEPRLRRRLTWLAAAAAAGVLLALLLPNRLNWRSDSPYLDSLTGVANYKQGSGRGRLIQYGNSLRMAAAHPLLGVGPGNWPVYYPEFRSPGDPSYDADDFIPTNPWPSSDWVAYVSERGIPAALLVGLVGTAVALGAWVRVRDAGARGARAIGARADSPHRANSLLRLDDLTVVATLIAVAVVGSFDAVLLLPVPTFFVWTVLGALASTPRPIREIRLTPPLRRRLIAVVATVGALFVLRTSAQILAMGLYDRTSRGEAAARVDPGSYRIHMLLGQSALAARRCGETRRHAAAALQLFPNHPAPKRLLRACGSRRA